MIIVLSVFILFFIIGLFVECDKLKTLKVKAFCRESAILHMFVLTKRVLLL